MWSCVLLDGALPALYFTLALLMSALSHRQWKDAWKWVVFGWCISWAALKLEAEHASPPPSSASATWLLLRPRFLPSVDYGDVPTTRSRGFWDFVDKNGHRGRVWMTAKWEGDAARWGLVIRRTIPSSDITASFDFKEFLERSGANSEVQFVAWGNSVPGSAFDRWSFRWGTMWRRHLAHTFHETGEGLILGVFAGDKSAVSRNVIKAFQELGVAHLLAVSGYHVGLVASLFAWLLRFQNRFLRRLSLLGVLGAGLFVAACGYPVSGVRSLLMFSLVWFSLVRGRRGDVWSAWGAAACWTVLDDHHVPNGLGGQLSFLATASLIALKGPWLWWKVPWRAQWATAPLTVSSFSVFPCAFYPSNLVAAPFMVAFGVFVGLGLAGLDWGAMWAERLASTVASKAVWLVETCNLSLENRRMSGWVGMMILVPISMFWVIRLIPDSFRRRALRGAVCGSCLVALGMRPWLDEHATEMWQLRGWPSCTMVTDGYGACAWCKERSVESAKEACRRLGLEGPCRVCGANGPLPVTQKKWIHPPFQAWIHREASTSTSALVPLE
jgi:ComEC/Rec2-related protein